MKRKGLFNKPLLTEEQFRERRRHHRKRRIIVYGSLLALAYGFFVWVPWNYDLIERKPEEPLPLVDPNTSNLFGKGTRIMVVTAHPDDSEFYIGGTLLKLGKAADIDQVIVTDGDKTFYWIFTDAAANRKVRHAEAEEALRTWGGKSLTFLGYPDGRLHLSDELVDKIAAKIAEVRPDYILGFDPDYPPRLSHSDHRRAGEATYAAAKKAGVGEWLMMFSTNAPNYISDVTDVWDKRLDLLKIHKSQWQGKRLEGVSNMIESSAVDQAERSNGTFGEAFRCVRIAEL